MNSDSTLQLVHVLFRHGDRTTDREAVYPNNPHIDESYYPYGPGKLTNKGKKRQYELGKSLRKRYDSFLGEMYTSDLLEAWSSDVNRTKASLQLVLAGLFPPVKELIWETGLNWQPIPFKTLPVENDILFLGCFLPKFKKYYKQIVNTPKVQEEFKRNSKILNYITQHTGMDIKTHWDLFRLYYCLCTEEEFGLTLPKWTKQVYPEFLERSAVKSYEINTSTTELKKLTSGFLLKKIVDDSKSKITSELSRRKIFLYSGHEMNIAHMLLTLNVFEPHIPAYGSYILFELHKIDDVYGFKIFYQGNNSNDPKLIKLPGCAEFCPLNKFISLVEQYFADKDFFKPDE